METKELKIQVPEGYEIDKENSTFECIKFKPIKKDITYEDVCNSIFETGYYINNRSEIVRINDFIKDVRIDKNNATNRRQLKRLLALNQLLNIAEYYNKLHPIKTLIPYVIIGYIYEESVKYEADIYNSRGWLYGVVALFNRKEDAQAVIDNPNFQEILDTIYKD